jgi:hypothetical protein
VSILPASSPKATEPAKQSGARWKIVNMKQDVIQIPVCGPQGEAGNKRVKASNYVTIGSSHDRGIVDTMRKRVIELDRGRVVRDQARGVYE